MKRSLKSISFLLVILFVLSSFVGCGQSTPAPSSAVSAEPSSQSAADSSNEVDPDYPKGNVQFIIPYATGGGTDSLGRLVAAELEQLWGKPVVVVNKPGAGSQLGITEMHNSKADGYTIGMITNFDFITSILTGDSPEYGFEDFEMLAQINATSNMLVAKPGSNFKSLEDVIAYAKEHPGELTVSSSGNGVPPAILALQQKAGVEFTPINYSSGGENLNALLGGHTDLCHIDKKFYDQIVDKGGVPLCLFSGNRLEIIKDLPTAKEQGYDVVVDTYRVFVVPKGTPEPIINKIRDSIVEISSTDKFQENLANLSEVYMLRTGDELAASLEADRKLIEAINS